MEFRDFSLLIQHTKVKGFVNGLRQGKLLASRCKACGSAHYPPRSDCPQCLDSDMEWIEVNSRGRLLTYTSVYVPPSHFTPNLSHTAPFSSYAYQPAPVGIVEMEDGLRVMGWICGVSQQELRVGMELSPRPEVLKDGRATVALRNVEC